MEIPNVQEKGTVERAFGQSGQATQAINGGQKDVSDPDRQQPIQDTEETAAYKAALDRRIDYLRREMEKVYEARNYMRTEDWRLRARVHETINKAVAGKQD